MATPLQYSYLENPTDRGAPAGCSPRGRRESDMALPTGVLTDVCFLSPPSQGAGRSSCGSSCWSFCLTAQIPTASPGRAPMGSSR